MASRIDIIVRARELAADMPEAMARPLPVWDIAFDLALVDVGEMAANDSAIADLLWTDYTRPITDGIADITANVAAGALLGSLDAANMLVIVPSISKTFTVRLLRSYDQLSLKSVTDPFIVKAYLDGLVLRFRNPADGTIGDEAGNGTLDGTLNYSASYRPLAANIADVPEQVVVRIIDRIIFRVMSPLEKAAAVEAYINRAKERMAANA